MEWQAVAKSVIGAKHSKNQTPCQDSSHYSIEENGTVLLGAVSDGMGSAEHSDVGSKLAVQSTIDIFKSKKIWKLTPNENEIKIVFESLVQDVQLRFRQETNSRNYSLDQLACTLIAFVATPKWFAAMQIGDGQIVVCSLNKTYQLVFKPDKGEYANETTPITSASALQEMRFCLHPTSYKFICAATDGTENISLVKAEGWKPFDKFFDGLMDSIESTDKTLLQKQQEVEDFLNSPNINSRTDDDKTLLLCSYGSFNSSKKAPNLDKENQSSLIDPDTTRRIEQENQKVLDCYSSFLEYLKSQILMMTASEGIPPKFERALKKNKKNKKIESIILEITFCTKTPLKSFQYLSERIEGIFADDNSVICPKEIEKVVVFNQDINTSSSYYVKEFILTKKKKWNIKIFSLEVLVISFLLMITGGIIFFFLISPNISNTKSIDSEPKSIPNATKAPSTTPSTVPPTTKATPSQTKTQKSPSPLPEPNLN